VGYDTMENDGCKCVKGIWGASEFREGDWEQRISYFIARELSKNEEDIFNILEAAYESDTVRLRANFCSSFLKSICLPDSIWEEARQACVKFLRGNKPNPANRYMPPLFEPTAKIIAEELGLKYAPPNELPLQTPLKVKEYNPYLAEEIRLFILSNKKITA
jgi:hypothetical protein